MRRGNIRGAEATGTTRPSAAGLRGSERCFGYDDLVFLLRSPHPSHLSWLAGFLRPHFRPRAATGAPIEVSVGVDPGRYARLAAWVRAGDGRSKAVKAHA